MRIKIVQGAESDETRLVEMTADLLRGSVESMQHELVEENPDVVHFVGAWERKSMAIARQAQQRHIATVHTPLASLAPWNNPTSSKKQLTAHCTTVVASGQLELLLMKDAQTEDLQMIKNPIVTATTTVEEMTEKYKDYYSQAYSRNEEALRNRVQKKITTLNEADKTITELCERLLYARFLYQRRNLPRRSLTELTELMTASDYDEDHLVELLRRLSLETFTQQLEFAMKEETGLTEGFMPIIWKEDKTAKDIIETITEYA